MIQLGAKPFCPIGYGDDGTPNGGVFANLDVWLDEQLLPKITTTTTGNSLHNLQPKSFFDEMIVEESPFKVHILPTKKEESVTIEEEEWQKKEYHDSYNDFFRNNLSPKTAYHYNQQSGKRILFQDSASSSSSIITSSNNNNTYPLKASVFINQRITAPDWTQDTRHLQLRVKTTSTHNSHLSSEIKQVDYNDDDSYVLPYIAGDVATIIPSNTPAMVSYFISVLPKTIQSMVDNPIQIDMKCNNNNSSSTSSSLLWPKYATLRGILTYCADISSLPEREDLRTLSYFCNLTRAMGKDQKEKIIALSETNDGAALFGDYVIR